MHFVNIFAIAVAMVGNIYENNYFDLDHLFIYILSMLKRQKTLEIRIDKLSEIIDDGRKTN